MSVHEGHRKGSVWLKNDFFAFLVEYIGSTLFLLMAFGCATIVNVPAGTTNTSSINAFGGTTTTLLLWFAFSFGMMLVVGAWVFFLSSETFFNPAICFALWLIGVMSPSRMILLTTAELLGGISAAAIVFRLSPNGLNTVTLDAFSVVQRLLSEILVTILSVFNVIMLTTAKRRSSEKQRASERQRSRFVAPANIGDWLFIAFLLTSHWTDFGANPARAYGPALAKASFRGYHWLYWLGPYLGAAVAAYLYRINKKLNLIGLGVPEQQASTRRK